MLDDDIDDMASAEAVLIVDESELLEEDVNEPLYGALSLEAGIDEALDSDGISLNETVPLTYDGVDVDAVIEFKLSDLELGDKFALLELGSNERLEGDSLLADDDTGMLADELASALSEKLAGLLGNEDDEVGASTILVGLEEEGPPSEEEENPVA